MTVRAALLRALCVGPGYGTELMTRLAGMMRDQKAPGPGTIYPALRQLEEGKLVRSWTRQVPGSRGRPRRYYELTIRGVEEAAAQTGLLGELARSGKPAGPPPDPAEMLLRIRRCARTSEFGMRLRDRASPTGFR